MKKRLILLMTTCLPALAVTGFLSLSTTSSPRSGAGDPLHATVNPLTGIVLYEEGNSYYLSPTGDDDKGLGTESSPWYSLQQAWTQVKPGDIIYMKGGSYRYDTSQRLRGKSGKANTMIRVWAMAGEKVIISPSKDYNGTRGIDIHGDYIHFRGLEITGYQQRSATALYYGIVAENSSNLIFDQLKVHGNGFGLSIGSDSGDNLVVNSDFYCNADPLSSFGRNKPWGGADGVTIRSSNFSKTNTIRGCRMWWNSDDGIDLFENQGTVIIENCWSFWNGYQPETFETAGDGDGFKLGITTTDLSNFERRILRNNLAFENKARGFNQNNARCITILYNNTTYNNAHRGIKARSYDFWNGTAATVARNNLDFQHSMQPIFNSQAIVSNNTFLKDGSPNNAFSVTREDFLSLDTQGVDGPRQENGNLPDLDFLKLAKGSDLINRGMNVGLPYHGTAPDIGAYERE
ncbi:MAG TPA: right-handed parallel beta-helix repeat-containing protein [Prolixibacteraceae bacterium]|nr:right-handed parallel beta-helix repeat-containing protein [Prolixibacteraceae bacterium]